MKQKLLLFTFTLLSVLSFSQSQPMALQEFKTTAGTQNFFIKSITKTDAFGNIYVGGATLNGAGNYDILVAKYNSSGVQLWIKQYAGAGNGTDFVGGMVVTDTYIILTGAVTTSTASPTTDIITMKYTSAGVFQWATTYNGTGNNFDAAKHVVLDGTGNIYITGASYNASVNTDMVTIKYNSSGVQQWASTYDYSAHLDDAATKVVISGSNLTVTGPVTSSTNNYKLATLTYAQSNGSLTATNISTTTTTSSITAVQDLTADASNNNYIVGSTFVTGQGYNYYVQKLSAVTLVSAWTYTYNGSSNLDDVAKNVVVDASGNVYITGYSTSSTQGRNIVTIKLNSSGTFQWSQTINGSLNGNDEANDMVIDASSNIYITGYHTIATNNTDYYTVKYNSSGTKIWDVFMDGYSLNDQATNMTLDSLNNVIVTGQTQTSTTGYNFTTVKYAQKDIIVPNELNGQINDKTFLFYENIGQEMSETLTSVPSKKFVTNSSPKYYFTGNNMSMVFASKTNANIIDTIHRIDINFEGSTSDNKIYGYEEFGINPTYILGQLSKPQIAPKGNQRMVISELYSGIDLQYYSNKNGGLKYYFVVKPGADPRNIKQFFSSTSYTTSINGSNQLIVTSSVGKITLSQPLAYQITSAGTPTAISGSSYWHSYASNKYDFTLPSYTSSVTLVVMVEQVATQSTLSSISLGNIKWSTFVGGGEADKNWDIVVDKFGNQHVTGSTASINYPTTGYQVIHSGFVFTNNQYGVYLKFNSSHKMIISSYIGGNDQTDSYDVKTNSLGDAYIMGTTSATNFLCAHEQGAYNDTAQGSTAVGAEEDCFIVKFNAANQYVWGTYFGGTHLDGATASAIDKNDNLYMVGRTRNSSLPLVANGSAYQHAWSGGRDVFIAKFNLNDSLVWFTYYGGTATDNAYSCKTDSLNNLYISGATYSSDFPTYRASSGYYKDSTLNGTQDLFILKFNPSGVRQWSTLYGGSGEEASLYTLTHKGIAFDRYQNIYVADNTTSTDITTKRLNGTCYYDSTFGGNIDGFLLRFNSSLSLQYSTYIGNTGYDYLHAIATDPNNNLYVSFGTGNSNITTQTFGGYYYQNTMTGAPLAGYGADNFLLNLNSNLGSRWATYLGGTSYNALGDEGTSIAINGSDMYITGYCNSFNANVTDVRFPIFYPGSPAYIDSTYNDYSQFSNTEDAFITMLDLSAIVGIEELVKNNSSSSLLLFPNPVNNGLNVKFTSDKQEKIKLCIFSIDGKLIFETVYPTIEGINLIQINTNSISTGMYLIQIQGKEYSISEKFIKNE